MKTLIVLLVLVPALTSCINVGVVRCGAGFFVTLAQRMGRADSDKPGQVVTCEKPDTVESGTQ
jgi:hypothetical protein